MNFELHELVYILGIMGTLAGLARFYFTRRADRDELIEWRVKLENRVSNQESYTKRLEVESKAADREHSETQKEILSKLNEIVVRIAQLEQSLSDHRRECEGSRQ